MDDEWRARLRAAIKRKGYKQYLVAQDAGITNVTLSRMLTNPKSNPYFSTIARLSRALDEPLSALVNEPAPLNAADLQDLQNAISILQRLLARSTGEQ